MKYFECIDFKHKHMDWNPKKNGGHHESKFGIIYSNGSHIGFNCTHISLNKAKKKGCDAESWQSALLDVLWKILT